MKLFKIINGIVLNVFLFSSLSFGSTRLEEEGVLQGYINSLNFVGAGLTAARSGIEGTITLDPSAFTSPGSNTQVLFNDGGLISGNAGLTFAKTTGNVGIGGDLTITGDDLFMNTNTTGYILRADGTNYNPVAFTQSSDLAGFLSDETGTGVAVFGTAPTFTTSITVPSILSTSGIVSIGGVGNTNNENITLDGETTSNRIILNSTTGASTLENRLQNLLIIDDNYLVIGDSFDFKFAYETTGNDNGQIGITCSTGYSGYVNLMERDDLGNANRSPVAGWPAGAVSDNPVWGVLSSDATVAGEGVFSWHDQTNGNFVSSTGNLKLGATSGSINIDDGTILTPSTDNVIVAATGITSAMFVGNTIVRVAGNSGNIDISANPQIADGTDGQMIILQGTHDTDTVQFDDGTGLALAGAVSFTMGKNDILCLIYDSGDDLWQEAYRSDN